MCALSASIQATYVGTYYSKLLAYYFDLRSPRASLEVGFRAAALAGAHPIGLRRRSRFNYNS